MNYGVICVLQLVNIAPAPTTFGVVASSHGLPMFVDSTVYTSIEVQCTADRKAIAAWLRELADGIDGLNNKEQSDD